MRHSAERRGSFIRPIPTKLDEKFHSSAFYRFFRSYDETDEKIKSSFFGRLIRPERLSGMIRTAKNAFAAKCEESILCNAIRGFYEKLPICSLRSVGVMFLYFSLYAAAIAAIRIAADKNVAEHADNLTAALVVLVLSLLLTAYKGSAADFLRKSRILSGIFDGLFFFRKGLAEKEAYRPQNGFLVLFGTLFGLVTYFVPVKSILLAVFLLFVVLSFFKMPENGMIVPILLCPFCTLRQLGLLCFAAFCGYLFKVLRGKRNFHIAGFDFMMMLFCVILFTACFRSTDREAICSEGIYKIMLLLLYFVIRNCRPCDDMLHKCARAVMLSGGIAGIAYLWNQFNGAGYVRLLERHMHVSFRFSPINLFESPIALGEFLLLCIPFGVMCFAVSENRNRSVAAVLCLAASVAPMILFRSKGLLLALAVGVLIYIVASFHNPVASAVTLVLVYLAFSIFITQSAFLGNDRFFNVNDYKESILAGTADIITDNPLAGIGIGKENFAQVFRVFTHFGDSSISECYNVFLQLLLQLGVFGALFAAVMVIHLYKMMFSTLSTQRRRNVLLQVCAISCISAVSSLMIRGFTSNVFDDRCVLLLFTVVAGYASAAYRIGRERNAETGGGESE